MFPGKPVNMDAHWEITGTVERDYVSGKGIGIHYEGEMINGAWWGKGVLTSDNGWRYEGEFVNGKQHGKGKLTTGKGEVYEGDFVQNQRHGYGVAVRPDGQRYEGCYANDKPNGKGKLWLPNGDCYAGEFDRGYLRGFVIFDGADGSHYEGTIADGKRHGEGVLTLPDGTVQASWFEKGEFAGENPRNDPEKQAYNQDHALAWSCSFYAIMLQNLGFEGNYINKFWHFFRIFSHACPKYCFCCLCIRSILLSLLQNENGCVTIG